MGFVIPRPAIRARENRAIQSAMQAAYERASFHVINLTNDESHGYYGTLSEARGCVEFDQLTEYQIWRGDNLLVCVESEPAQ